MKPLTVGDMMTRDLITLKPEDNLEIFRDAMVENHIRHIPVVDPRGELLGLVTHRDLLRNTLMERARIPRLVEDSVLRSIAASEVMTKALKTISPSADLRAAARLMLYNKLGCLPVLDDGEGALLGILTEADFLRAVLYED